MNYSCGYIGHTFVLFILIFENPVHALPKQRKINSVLVPEQFLKVTLIENGKIFPYHPFEFGYAHFALVLGEGIEGRGGADVEMLVAIELEY